MGEDQQPAARPGVVRHAADTTTSHPPRVYHSASSEQQHDTGRSPRVTAPPTSSAVSPMSQPPLLPPLQQQQQQQQQQAPQHYDGAAHMHAQAQQQQQYAAPSMQHHAPPPPYNPQQHPYAYQNGAMQHPPSMPSTMMVNGNGTMRYALPPQMAQGNMAARTANAKQIKRRTKTGCLTCRKRRIKCDEAHPTCRNCQKSKRECLGYDPIFKQQPGPAPLQPAPAGTATDTNSASPTLPSGDTYSPIYKYTPTASSLYSSSHQPQTGSSHDLASGLDPTLSPSEQSGAMAQYNGPPLQASRKESSVTMAQLFALDGVEPRWQKREAPPPGLEVAEIESFYRFHYAQGLDKLYETTWYTTHGWAHLQHDAPLMDYAAQCSEQMKSSTNEPSSVQAVASLEARLVWQLSVMPRSAQTANQAYGAISDPLLSDLLPRIDTVENILTGQFLPMVQIPSPPSVDHHQSDHRKYNEMHFWHQLGRIASTHDDSPDPAASRDINDALSAMRSVLGLMENRDVLYSLAIARYIGGRLPEYDPLTPLTRTGDPEHEIDKLETARGHIVMENDKGMTQVVQRICGMAMRSSVLQRQ